MKGIYVSLLLAMAISGPTIYSEAAKSAASEAEQQAICSYITASMSSVISQVPTLCSAARDEASKHEKSQYFDIDIFASGNVLQGPQRRAWLSALFQTLEGVAHETPLNKACSPDNVCLLSFADTQMSEHSLRYELYLRSSEVNSLQSMLKANSSSEFSELWYELWWGSLHKVSSHPGSKENSKLLGQDACKSFLDLASKQAKEYGKEPPSCSVQLATAEEIYLVIDFSDLIKALTGDLIADSILPGTVASRLNDTGYGGDVVIRSPWFKTADGNERAYRIYHLRDLEFAYEEERGGLRSESDVDVLLAMRYRSSGVTSQNHLVADPKTDSVIRPVAVLSITQGTDGSQIVDTTDGAAWRVSAKSSTDCDLQPGRGVFVFAPSDTNAILTTSYKGKSCKLDASFVMGW